MDMDLDDLWLTAKVLILTLLIAALAGCAVAVLQRQHCKNTAGILEIPHQFSIVSGCFVQENGEWMHYEEYKLRKTAYDGLRESQ